MPAQETQLLDVPAIATATGLTVRTVKDLIYAKRALPVVKVGRRVYVRHADLIAWLDRNTSPARG